LANTACTDAFKPLRQATNFARCRTNSRSSRTAGGAIQPSGSRPHPQQVRQIGGVTHVVLHPAIGKALHTQRMREMDVSTGIAQHVDRPIPAVRGLQHHLRVLTGLRDLGREGHRIIVDTHPAEPLTDLGHPHDHRPPPVQIDTHHLASVVLCRHVGPNKKYRVGVAILGSESRR
jgi:hypothetical protein